MRSSFLVLMAPVFAESRQTRALDRENFMESLLSKDKCGLVAAALDDCKIASCKDDDRNKVDTEEIPVGAICRVKCRSLKATRCRCCAAGFEIGKKCPEDEDEDSCELMVDESAIYEGPNAELFPAMDWQQCYQACVDRGMECVAASYVKLRFNSMCWVFNEITTRYADEEEEQTNSFGGPTRELFMVRSLQKGKKSKKSKVNTVTTKPVSALNLDLNQSSGAVGPLTRSGGRMGDPSKINPIAKGDAAKSGLTLNADPVMRSWSRPCNL